MSSENLIEGADAYTDLTEVAEEQQTEAPEASPAIVASAIGSFVTSFNTVKGGC